MVKLTVLYNLRKGVDPQEFLKWRLTTHHDETMALPKIIRSDLYIAKDAPDGTPPKYKFVSESYFPNIEALATLFYSEAIQTNLKRTTQDITDTVFLLCEKVSGAGEEGGEWKNA